MQLVVRKSRGTVYRGTVFTTGELYSTYNGSLLPKYDRNFLYLYITLQLVFQIPGWKETHCVVGECPQSSVLMLFQPISRLTENKH